MLQIFEHSEGVFNFSAQHQNNVISPAINHIPGATTYQAEQSSGYFFYQIFQHSLYTLYRSTYVPVRNMILQVTNPVPYTGFRIMLKKHIKHQINEQNYSMLQGQANFVYAPQVTSALHLETGQRYEVFDMELSATLVGKMQLHSKPFAVFIDNTTSGNTQALGEGPAFTSARILDLTDELLINPDNEQLATLLLELVIEAVTRSRPKRVPDQWQIENLFAVRDSIRRRIASQAYLKEWAYQSGMNITYFKEYFKDIFDMAPYQYLLYERIKMAKFLLKHQPHLSKGEVAQACGFNDYNNLRRAFLIAERTALAKWLNS